MGRSRTGLTLACAVLLGALTVRAEDSQPPRPADARPTPPAAPASPRGDEKAPEASGLERFKLPPGTVLMLADEAKEALKLIPRAVVLTPEKYQELLDQIEQLKRQARPEKPEPPSSCRLVVQVEEGTARIRAQYEFRTERPRALVLLGGQRASPTAATLDEDRTPVLELTDDGWVARVDAPGSHRLTLDLVGQLVAKGARGTDRGLDVGLPRAAITTLETLELPGNVPEVRVAGKPVRARPVEGQRQTRLENLPLGPAERLDVAWKTSAGASAKGPPLLTGRARVQVRVDDAHVFTDVEFTLEVLREETSVWRILVPLAPQAMLEKLQPADERIQSITYPETGNPVLTIRLKDPSAEPLRVPLHVRQPRLGTPVPVGPFVVLDALPQGGTIEVRAPADLRLRYHLGREVSQRPVTEDQRRDNVVAAFAYWNAAAGPGPLPAVPAPVTLEVEAVKGAAEARVSHVVHFAESGPAGRSTWRVASKIDVTPLRTGVDYLEVQLPAGYQYDAEVGPVPADLVEDVVLDPAAHRARVKLAQKQFRSFSVTLTGTVPTSDGAGAAASAVHSAVHEVALDLPRPQAWGLDRDVGADRPSPLLDRGGQVTVTVPEGQVILPRRPGAEGPRPGSREYTWHLERFPAQAEWGWQDHRPELTASSVVDLTLGENQVRVRQVMRFRLPAGPSAPVLLRVPEAVRATARIAEGGKPEVPPDPAQGEWAVQLDDSAEPEHRLTLTYSFPVNRGRFQVPLIAAGPARGGDTRVRVWGDPGTQVAQLGAWEELPVEEVAERPHSLPLVVLRGGAGALLALHVTEPAGGSPAAVLVARVLVQARAGSDGHQTLRARYLLTPPVARSLDVLLPVAVQRPALEVLLDGRQVPWQLLDETGRESEGGRVARLKAEREVYGRPAVLDVTCQLEPGRPAAGDAWQTVLRPPQLLGSILLGQTRWALELPPRKLPLHAQGDATPEQRWGWHGLMLAPRPASDRAELERWLTGADPGEPADDREPSLVCRQDTLAPLTVVAVPQQLWLLACSLGFLAVGLLLFFYRPPPWLFWPAVALLALAVLLVGVLWPDGLAAVVYGCEPGLVILVMVLAVQWMLHQRYRRQVVFMPGFTRVKSGSSLVRAGAKRPREPSTVDEPAKRGSSVAPGLQP